MTVQIIIGALVALSAFVITGLAALIWILRGYAHRYKRTSEGRCNIDAGLLGSRGVAPALGAAVKFHDASGRVYDALITAVHNVRMVNLVIVSKDEARSDGYGRELERATSVPHESMTQTQGYYFRFPDEEPNIYLSAAREIQFGAKEPVQRKELINA